MRKSLVPLCLAVSTLAAGPAPAAADVHGVPNFAGTCSIDGSAAFSSPLMATPGLNSYTFTSTGPSTCTGRLAYGVTNLGTRTWKIAASASNSGTLACGASYVQNGKARIEFLNDDGTPVMSGTHPLVITADLDTLAVGNQVALVIRGGRVGRYPEGTNARGTAEFAADPATVQGCLGAGVSSLGFKATIETGPSRRGRGNPPTYDNVLVSKNAT